MMDFLGPPPFKEKGLVSIFTGPPKVDRSAQRAAERRQKELQDQQEATQARLRQKEDERQTDLSSQDAAQRRAIRARRAGRSSLRFTPSAGDLKDKLGG